MEIPLAVLKLKFRSFCFLFSSCCMHGNTACGIETSVGRASKILSKVACMEIPLAVLKRVSIIFLISDTNRCMHGNTACGIETITDGIISFGT